MRLAGDVKPGLRTEGAAVHGSATNLNWVLLPELLFLLSALIFEFYQRKYEFALLAASPNYWIADSLRSFG
jgi:hypothetical protein